MKKALLILDFINDIVHPDWKLSWKWYSEFMQEYKVVEKLNAKIDSFRKKDNLIIFVKVCFSKWYIDQPKKSILFGKAHEFWVLKNWSRWTDFFKDISYEKDIVVVKHRVNSFFWTDLDLILRNNNIEEIYLAGCSTDLVVESTARDAHDRDYQVSILNDCCVAANINDHKNSLKVMEKFCNIV